MSTSSPDTAAETGLEKLLVADWRRRISELYAEVRRTALANPAAAHFQWCAVREAAYRTHGSSPVPAERRSDFRALHFPYDPGLRFELPLIVDGAVPVAPGAAPLLLGSMALPASTGEAPGSDRVGWVDVPFEDRPRRLAVFWLREYTGGIFLPFRDGTNGVETYGGGRYLLDTAKGADLGGDPDAGTIVVDFNFAYQPSCAFDPKWSCPLSPPENRLDLPIRAGERIA